MSYVLDAQRKRHQHSTPELAAQYAMADAKRRRLMLLGNIVAVIVIVVLATLLWLTNSDSEPTASGTRAQMPAPQAAPQESQPAPNVQADVAQTPAQPATIEEPVNLPQQTDSAPPSRNVQPDPAPQVRTPPPEKPLTQLHEAQAATQDALLGFSYSSHIYGDDEDGRMIFVDGRKLTVGETHNGWTLQDITQDGVIWENADERVHVSVLDLWQ